jgi:hypothetical protein
MIFNFLLNYMLFFPQQRAGLSTSIVEYYDLVTIQLTWLLFLCSSVSWEGESALSSVCLKNTLPLSRSDLVHAQSDLVHDHFACVEEC